MIKFIIALINIFVFLYIVTFLHIWFKKTYKLKDFIKKTNKIIIFILIYTFLVFNLY